MSRPNSASLLSIASVALALAVLVAPPSARAQSTSQQKLAASIAKLEGIWKVEPLGASGGGVDFIRFGAGNSAQWYHFESKDDCWTSRHQYRLVRDRILFSPELSDGRSWWQPSFETPARIELLQRTKTESGRSSRRVRLVRASLYQADCEIRESE